MAHLESEKKASGVAERADSSKVRTPSQEDVATQSWSQAQPNAPESDTEEEEEGGHLDDGSPKRSSQTFYLQDERDDLEMSRIPEDFFHMDPEFENTGEGEKPDPLQRPCVPEPVRYVHFGFIFFKNYMAFCRKTPLWYSTSVTLNKHQNWAYLLAS